MKHPVHTRAPRAGFTLIELLAVIVIVGILASVIFALVGQGRKAAQNAGCLSKLRQIATGIQLYANDNRRLLPGPVYVLQGPFYNIDYRRLPMRLRPYLGNPAATSYSTALSAMTYGEIFACPTWAADRDTDTIYSYALNDRIPRPGMAALNPWGAGDPNGTGDPAQASPPPIRVTEFEERGVPKAGSAWLIADADLEFPAVGGTFWRVPAKPVHGGHRNAIFCDLHVGRMDLNNLPLN